LAIGASPAQIKSWCLTAIATAETQHRGLSLRDLVDLVAPPNARSAEMDKTVAIHEAGHAIVAHDLGLPIEEISILSLGDVGGFVNTGPHERTILTRSEIERFGTVLLGGRAADIVLGRGANAGAASDLEAVNHLLRSAMLDLGLYGSIKTAKNVDSRNFRDGVTLATAIEIELNRLLERTIEIVTRRQRDISCLVEVLLPERVVSGERFHEILAGGSSQRSSVI
jgi:cell division protease FtsH